jgi:hypothetical protein
MADKLTTGDILAIHDQIARYALYADEGDFPAVGALLSDADFYAQGVLIVSKDAALMTRRFAESPRPAGAARRHFTTNIVLDAVGEDGATATSYYIWMETLPDEASRMLQCGVYRDTFKKFESGWRFIERRAEGDGVQTKR